MVVVARIFLLGLRWYLRAAFSVILMAGALLISRPIWNAADSVLVNFYFVLMIPYSELLTSLDIPGTAWWYGVWNWPTFIGFLIFYFTFFLGLAALTDFLQTRCRVAVLPAR